jgi:GntR family transcriptional repressor for pyruvate dehydrogenase complex
MDNLNLKPVKNKKAYMQIIEEIIRLLNENKIEYGDKLYSEPELTSMLNVSRPTLREALRVLEFLGIVTVSPRKGIRINKPESTKSYMPLIYVLMFEKTSDLELFELRRSIQMSMVELAAEKRTEEDLKVLEEIIKMNKEHIGDNLDIFAKIDYDFHMQIVKCSGNSLCYKLMETLNILMRKQFYEITYNLPLDKRDRIVNYHTKIFESIRDRKPDEAIDYMCKHMERAYNYYKGNKTAISE